ncbi:DUF4870 domain-containing protein [Nocardioides sp.]|uniref:DUF4870 domain-containing protein n=1 Tax=Nocardioides sp. TaxID=35761 RepID=UPI003D12028F
MSDTEGTPDFTKRPDQPADQPPPAPPYGQTPTPPYGQPQPPQQPYGQPQQPYGAPAQQPYGAAAPAGAPLRPDEEKTWGILAHAGGFILGFISPLIVWLVFKDRSAWVDRTSKEALNFQISYAIYLFASGISIFLLVGIILFPVVIVAYYVFMIIGIVKAASLQDYRFPLILRLVS